LAVEKGQVPLVHNFVKSPIKARIKMLFNDKSKNMKKLIYMLALPIGMMLIWGFTIDIIDVLPKQGAQEKQFTVVLDAGHGGKDAGARINGFTEKNITLSMAQKIKAIAEAKGIKVILTRSADENVALLDRAKLGGGDILISLHVNSAPTKMTNGVDMFTSGTYEKDLKFARSNSLTYHLYKNMRNATGIKINNKPKNQNLLILKETSMPGVVLELGYLTNKNDLQYITNSQKQDELAKLIVDGIVDFQQKTPSKEEQSRFQKMADELNIKYTAWKKSAKYKALVEETKNFKAQQLVGNIQSLNYFHRGNTPDLDGFIINAKGKLYRVYLTKEQLKAITYKVGDQIICYAAKTEVWFDSEYPVIQPKTVTVIPIVGVQPAKFVPCLIHSTSLVADIKTNTFYIKKGKIEVGNQLFLEAEDMTWDKNTSLITAQKGTIAGRNGNIVTGENLIYNLNTGSYKIMRAEGKINPTNSSAYELINKLPYNASDSVRISKTESTITLFGKASINIDGTKITGDKIELNKSSNIITAYNGEITGLDKQPVKAKVISYNVVTKKGILTGVIIKSAEWDKVMN
jgi:N-acetylmuramoyl-L-alanine amidase/lipopolysaccharide export system protein LptA